MVVLKVNHREFASASLPALRSCFLTEPGKIMRPCVRSGHSAAGGATFAPICFVYFFDDLKEDPAGLRRSILGFLGADPDKPSGPLSADYNGQAGSEKRLLTNKVRSRVAQFFEEELKDCAAELGGPAKEWPARYGFRYSSFSGR
jgi:hypothetical protein